VVSVERFGRYQDGVKTLPADQRDRIEDLGERIEQSFKHKGCKPLKSLELVGHADHDPSRGQAFELDISKKRATRVTEDLMAQLKRRIGAHSSQIKTKENGVGSSDMKFKNPATELQHEENRRVVITTAY
jgi:flagellar motor protein MotB